MDPGYRPEAGKGKGQEREKQAAGVVLPSFLGLPGQITRNEFAPSSGGWRSRVHARTARRPKALGGNAGSPRPQGCRPSWWSLPCGHVRMVSACCISRPVSPRVCISSAVSVLGRTCLWSKDPPSSTVTSCRNIYLSLQRPLFQIRLLSQVLGRRIFWGPLSEQLQSALWPSTHPLHPECWLMM